MIITLLNSSKLKKGMLKQIIILKICVLIAVVILTGRIDYAQSRITVNGNVNGKTSRNKQGIYPF